MSAQFHTNLCVTPIEGRRWVLMTPLVYDSVVASLTLTVPSGFVFDGNSVPRVTWSVSPPTDYMEAGCVHDFLYATGTVSRRLADEIYREALGVIGAGRLRCFMRFWAVRLFGRSAYQATTGEKLAPSWP